MKPRLIFICSVTVLFCSCGNGSRKGSADGTQIKKNYNEFGVLESEISHIDGIKHGPARYYYENGNLQYLIPYEHGKKHGESIWYYENGDIYQVTPFIHGKEHGVRKKYYPSGELMSEVPYFEGEQIPGMKEYKENGELITDYPEIVFLEPEKTSPDRYFLRFHMSNKSRNVRFQQSIISNDGDTLMADVPTRDGVGEIPFFVSKGGSVRTTVTVYAAVNTPLRNVYHTAGTCRVNIVNK